MQSSENGRFSIRAREKNDLFPVIIAGPKFHCTVYVYACIHLFMTSKAVQATRYRGASNYIAIATRNENMGLATSDSKTTQVAS